MDTEQEIIDLKCSKKDSFSLEEKILERLGNIYLQVVKNRLCRYPAEMRCPFRDNDLSRSFPAI